MIELDQLRPVESMAHRVAVAQIRRGEVPGPNVMFALGLGLLRLMGEVDDDYEVIA